MKMNKSLLIAMAMSAAGLANAGTVYITGSTALRSSVQAALLTPGIVFSSAPSYTVFQGGSTGNNAGNGGNYMAFVGTAQDGSGALTVQCHWSGSEAGIQDLATSANGSFIAAGLIDGLDHGTNVPASFDTAQVDLAMADNAQEFSRNPTPILFTNKSVGVITFAWVRNPGLWDGTYATGSLSNNVSSAQIIQALNAAAPRSVFDGNTNHQGDYVYVSGRNYLSGTRVNTFGDCGFGILTPPSQIEVNKATGEMQADTDANGTPGVIVGDIGFDSGGTLAGTLGTSTVGKTDQVNGGLGGYSVISYLSRGDADTAIAAGAKECSYNGVAFSRNGIIEGSYTMWGNAYIFQRQSPVASSQAQGVYFRLGPNGGIATAIGHASTRAIPFSDMHCLRNGPNSVPGHN